MRVALVHDDLMQWGGAEKVFAQISDIFPEAPIYTAIADLKNPLIGKNFKGKKIITSFLQKLPFHKQSLPTYVVKKLYKPLMPLYPIAFEQFDFSKFDLVISHTTRFAKSIITRPETTHVCYTHTPPRFLWNFSGEKPNPIIAPFMKWFKTYDKVSSKRVDFWIAGSKNCQERLKNIYQVGSKVLYPFVDLEKFNLSKGFIGDYYLIISRFNKYKKVDVAVRTFNESGKRLIVVGDGPEFNKLKTLANENIQILGKVNDELLENLLAGCKGLIITAEEDFGMTSIEAQAFGKGVIAFGAGGSLETIIPGTTGVYFNEQSVPSLEKAIQVFESIKFDPQKCFENAEKFSRERFKEKLLALVKEASALD